MKTLISTFAAVLAATALEAVPTVSGVAVTQGADKLVKVSYDLSEQAIVTVDFQIGGVSLDKKLFADVSGDVNHVVKAGSGKQICWNPDYVQALSGTNGTLSAVVKAWSLASPPDYMVWRSDENVAKRSIFFYETADALPEGGLANDIYSRHRLVMRRIHAAGVEWRMGTTGTQREYTGGGQKREWPHYVKLTKDYYMSIYPLTQRQVRDFAAWPRSPTPYNASNMAATESHPFNNVAFSELRGATEGVKWPLLSGTETEAHAVDKGSIIAVLREHTGVSTFDLPTRAQYEFAQRAGTGTLYYNGVDAVTPEMESGADQYCHTGLSAPVKVGLLKPNSWGLYDMSGNGLSWVLDRQWDGIIPTNDLVIDPRGTDAGTYTRFLVGSEFLTSVKGGYSGAATFQKENGAWDASYTFRVVCDADMSVELSGL